MPRTDVHRPADFDPADYEVVDYIDNRRPEPPTFALSAQAAELYRQAVQRWEDRVWQYFPNWRTGADDHRSIHQCNHCGHPGIRWVAVVKYIPSGDFLAFGEICAERCDLNGRDAFRAKFIKDRAAREAAALEKQLRRDAFRAANEDVVAFLEAVEDRYNGYGEADFLTSLKQQLASKGELSEAQVAAARRSIQRQAERDARRAAEQAALATAPALPEGRREITGEIVSTKVTHGTYGETFKMLVREDDGNKVYGTIAQALWSQLAAKGNSDGLNGFRGERVTMTAKVERSRDDQHFGFFSRPTNAHLLDAPVGTGCTCDQAEHQFAAEALDCPIHGEENCRAAEEQQRSEIEAENAWLVAAEAPTADDMAFDRYEREIGLT